QPYRDTEGRSSTWTGRPASDASLAAPSCASAENENPPRIAPGGPTSSRNLAPAGTSAVSSSVASDSLHIGRDHEHSMTANDVSRGRLHGRRRPACPLRVLGLAPRRWKTR